MPQHKKMFTGLRYQIAIYVAMLYKLYLAKTSGFLLLVVERNLIINHILYLKIK